MSLNYTVGEGFTKVAATGKPIYSFRISGEVDFPVLTEYGAGLYVTESFTATKGSLTTTRTGDLTGSIYNFKVTSYDNGRNTSTVIVNQTFTMATFKVLTLLNTNVQLGQFVLEIQHVSGPVLGDFTLTIE